MRAAIEKFRKVSKPKFVGVRYLFPWDGEDYLMREDVHKGLQLLVDNGLTFDWHSMTSGSGSPFVVCNVKLSIFILRSAIHYQTHSNDCKKISNFEDCH